MTEEYYCEKCGAYVIPIMGAFQHPHLGVQACKICPKGHMVYLKNKGDELEKEVK